MLYFIILSILLFAYFYTLLENRKLELEKEILKKRYNEYFENKEIEKNFLKKEYDNLQSELDEKEISKEKIENLYNELKLEKEKIVKNNELEKERLTNIYKKIKQEKEILKKEKEKLIDKNKKLMESIQKEYEPIVALEKAITLKKNELLLLEKEIKRAEDKNIKEKERALKILAKQNDLRKEVASLEEKRDLQEFSFYEPKYYYENSEKYKIKLDKLNQKMKEAIKSGNAATCSVEWVVEKDRKRGKKMIEDHLKLMLRAFNGEVDAAIAKVKFYNMEIMEKRIYRAYETINKLNETNYCEITRKYLYLKLQELTLNYEMAMKIEEEKEEQRAIKEQIREEEKAQREFEKMQIEAQKEEEKAQKALLDAEENLKKAHGIEMEKLYKKIEFLKEKLKEAEKNKERAKSMAQQTKSGYVYVISNIGSFGENIYKIGMTRRLDPMDRVRELGDASVPFNFDVHAMMYSKNAPELENLLHKKFYNNRVNKINDRREFFRVELSKIEEVAKNYGIDIEFTKIALAEQYRRTLSIEKELKEKIDIITEVNKSAYEEVRKL